MTATTHSAADTSRLAIRAHFLAFGVIGTGNVDLRSGRDLLNQLFRAGLCAFAAQGTTLVSNRGIPFIRKIAGMMIAMLHTSPCTHTPHRTSLSSAREKLHRCAITVSMIIVFILTSASAVTANDEGHFLPFVHRAEDLCDFVFIDLARCVTIGEICFPIRERLRKRAATCVSASAAVRAGKQRFHLHDLLVALNLELTSEEGKQHRKDSRNRDQHPGGNEDRHI